MSNNFFQVHVDADAMTEDRWNPTRTYRYPMWVLQSWSGVL